MSTSYKVASLGDLQPGSAACVQAGACTLALYNVEGEYYATQDECSHAEASLSDGWLEEYEIVCPLHGAAFDVRSGKPKSLPATRPVQTYPVRIEGQDIYVEVED